MTDPRCITPGATYLFTRRCSERRLFLLPSPTVTEIVEYLLAVYASEFRIRIHAYTWLSNHLHVVLTDVEGQLPRFTQALDSMVARAVNAERGRWEHFWDSRKPSYVRLLRPDDVYEKILYTLANPVSSWLVDAARKWPGAKSTPADYARTQPRVLRRPDHARFFSEQSSLPDAAPIDVVPPTGFEEMTRHEFADTVAKDLRLREHELRQQAEREGKRFLGAHRVLRQDPLSTPTSTAERRTLDPNVACKDRSLRIAFLERLRAFRESYERARLRFQSRQWTTTVLPHGTWWLRIHCGVSCAQPP